MLDAGDLVVEENLRGLTVDVHLETVNVVEVDIEIVEDVHDDLGVFCKGGYYGRECGDDVDAVLDVDRVDLVVEEHVLFADLLDLVRTEPDDIGELVRVAHDAFDFLLEIIVDKLFIGADTFLENFSRLLSAVADSAHGSLVVRGRVAVVNGWLFLRVPLVDLGVLCEVLDLDFFVRFSDNF